MTYDELAVLSPRRAELARVLREEVRAGRVRLEGDRYELVPERFEPGLLAALSEVEGLM